MDAVYVDAAAKQIREYRPKAALVRLLVSLGGYVSGDPDVGRGSISEQLYLTTSVPPAAVRHDRVHGRSRRVVSVERVGIPLPQRPIMLARITAGESLRALAREYGVSHETIRRVARAAVTPF